jgi:hypothetical protein
VTNLFLRCRNTTSRTEQPMVYPGGLWFAIVTRIERTCRRSRPQRALGKPTVIKLELRETQ